MTGCYPQEGLVHVNMDDDLDLTPEQEQAITDAGCCIGSGVYGPHRCTCWEPVYDIPEQGDPTPAPAATRDQMCQDCAYRPDSPERTGDPHQKAAAPGELDRIAHESTFWCHTGMRRLVAYEHPIVGRVAPRGVSYDPPSIDAVPYKADGTPADRCAGWAARRVQLGLDL